MVSWSQILRAIKKVVTEETFLSNYVIVSVAVPAPFRYPLSYALSTKTNYSSTGLGSGIRVIVPLGARNALGLSLYGTAALQTPSEYKIKAIISVLDSEPIINAEVLLLSQWSADYYQHPIGQVLQYVLPALLRKGAAAKIQGQCGWQLTDAGRCVDITSLARAPKQVELIRLLLESEAGLTEADLNHRLPGWRPAVKRLEEKAWVISSSTLTGLNQIETTAAKNSTNALSLNAAQQSVLESLTAALGKFAVHLLHGVTGSGKTEVYLQLCQSVLAQGKQVLILVPEIGLTPQILERFKGRFSQLVSPLHSGLGDRQRLDHWLSAQQGQTRIVIGTRSAAFVPLPDLGLIIIDEEHDASFKQHEGFRFSARDVLIKRAQQLNIPILLGSATPALETLQHAWTGKYQYHGLPARAGCAEIPEVEILDVRSQGLQDGLSNRLISDMRRQLEAGNQVLLFLNRRGFAPTLLCHACGWVAECRRCDSHMTLYNGKTRLRCHHCDAQAVVPAVCPNCQATELIAVGEGTERIETTLTALFPATEIIRIDRDSTRKKGSLADMLASIHAGGPKILLGTQMLAKGHDFPEVTLVGILNTDQGLFSVDFRATERMAQLLVQVSGRAGRADKPGRVLIQTHHPDHPLLQCLVRDGYSEFARRLLQEREAAAMPPFSFLCLLRAEASQDGLALNFLREAKALVLPTLPPGMSLWGPTPAPMARRAGRIRAQLLLHSQQRTGRQAFLQQWVEQLDKLPIGRKVRWSLDVDPLEML